MGGAGKTIGRGVLAGATGGLSEFGQKNPFGAPIQNPLHAPINNAARYLGFNLFGDPLDMVGQGTPDNPFAIDPNKIASDKQAIVDLGNTQAQDIRNLGEKQYGQTNEFITGDQASRDAARQRLSEALIKQNQAFFQQGLPATEETLNAQHLLNGSGLGQEIARQQGTLATNIANEVGATGARDYDYASQQRAAALQGLLGSQSQGLATSQAGGSNALSRGFSLEDFVRASNVAKVIGAQAAPQVSNTKGQTGTLLGGVGALAPLVTAAKGTGKAAAAA